MIEYPAFICFDCGEKHGKRKAGICTMHMGECDLCGRRAMLTEPRDFGHLNEGWLDALQVKQAKPR